jgi:predicted metalloprotease with PDZ domain
MRNLLSSKAILLFAAIAVLTMYQETEAQRKKPTPKPAAVAESNPTPSDISYTVGMSQPWTHLLEVEMRVKWTSPNKVAPKTELKMPVWTPGSYLVREYARHVQNFAVKDGTGKTLPWRKTTKNTWQVDTTGITELVATYKVYSNELTVRTNELNDDHAFWNNTALLFFVKGQLKMPSTVEVKPYGNWRVATGLPAVADKPNTFRAPDFDVLYDSPFEVSDFKEFKFTAAGKPHRYVISGDGNYDAPKLVADTIKIIDETVKIFGDVPYDDYTFIVNTRGGGGLEHLNSTALQINRFGFKPNSRYVGFLGLVAHEFFHAYNVKRMRPDVLGPFDYENENYTNLLWVAEGGTEYYSNLILVRAGLMSDKEYLGQRAAGIQALQNRPGRFETSLEESSFDAWIKYYRQDENSVNNQISYYDKGEIVTLMLDLAIRGATDGAKSLDDVMRALYNDYYKTNKNFSDADFQRECEKAAGKSLDDFFAKYVRGRDEIDYNSFASAIGLTLNGRATNAGRPYIGADLAEDAGRLTIRSITAGTPAYDQGLNTGDQIVAIDGYRASQAFLQSYINERKPGDKVRLSIFRFDKMRDINFTLGNNDRKDYFFGPVATPTEAQQRLYKQFLNAELQ